jgi:hypothetical protein
MVTVAPLCCSEVRGVEAGSIQHMKKLWHALADKLLGGSLPPAAWIDTRGTRLPWLLLALTLPFLLTGPIRAVTSLGLALSLVLSLVLCAGLVALLWPWLRGQGRSSLSPGQWILEAVALLPVGFAIWALYVRDFGGFPNLDGWDGGTHVLNKSLFGTVVPSVYSGQVATYAFTWWLEKLFQLNALQSFAIAFYVSVTAMVAFPLTITFALVREEAAANRAAWMVGVGVTVLATVGLLLLAGLPLLHYNQAAGYYVHLFGLLPLMMLWAADALIRLHWLRVAALIGAFVLLRYTYALNLADAAVAVAFVLLVEGFRGRWRIVQGVLVVGLCLVAVQIVSELRPVFRVWGGMQRFDVDKIFKADVLVLAALPVYLLAASRKPIPAGWLSSPLFRAIRFPLSFAVASSALFLVLRKGPGVKYYYATKYQIWACLLLGFVLVILLGHLATTLARWSSLRRPVVWLRVAVVTALLATVPSLWATTFAGYSKSLQERMRPHALVYRHLRPLADVQAIARIKAVLSGEHKVFGGYLTAFFPMFSFMNATLGYHKGMQDFFPPETSPGNCVFWVAKAHDIYRLGPVDKLDALRDQVAAAGATCVEYPVPWKSTPQSLCYHCY